MLFQAKRIVPLIALCAALLAGIVYAVPQPARAADKPSITIESELGFNGNVKLGEWNPLTITLTSSADISGELVVGAQIPYTGGVQPISRRWICRPARRKSYLCGAWKPFRPI